MPRRLAISATIDFGLDIAAQGHGPDRKLIITEENRGFSGDFDAAVDYASTHNGFGFKKIPFGSKDDKQHIS